MDNNKNFEIVDDLMIEKINENNYLFSEENGKKGIITIDATSNDILSMSYKYFFIDTTEKLFTKEGKRITKVYVENKVALKTVIKHLQEGLSDYFWEVVFEVDEAFSTNSNDVNKFRGDLAEAIFCYVTGAEKIANDFESVDIVLNGETAEIKSFGSSRKITISKQQSINKVKTYAVELVHANTDEGGMTLIDIAVQLKGQNVKFKKYLLEEYSETDLGNVFTYKVDDSIIKDITNIIQNSLTHDWIIEATFRISEDY